MVNQDPQQKNGAILGADGMEIRAGNNAADRVGKLLKYIDGDPSQASFSVIFDGDNAFHRLMHAFFLSELEKISFVDKSEPIVDEVQVFEHDGVQLTRKGIEGCRIESGRGVPTGTVAAVMYFASRKESE